MFILLHVVKYLIHTLMAVAIGSFRYSSYENLKSLGFLKVNYFIRMSDLYINKIVTKPTCNRRCALKSFLQFLACAIAIKRDCTG